MLITPAIETAPSSMVWAAIQEEEEEEEEEKKP